MKKYSLLVLSFALILILAACGSKKETATEEKTAGESSENTVAITNEYKMMGEKEDGSDAKDVSEKVEVPKNSKKVAVFDYGTLTTMQELGLADHVIGLPKGEGNRSVPEFLKEFKDDKYTNLGSLKEPNFEKLAELSPEVILISGRQASAKVLDEMKKAAPDAKIVYVGTKDTAYVESVKANTDNIGKMFDKEDATTKLNKALDDKIAEVKKMTAASDKKGLFVLANEGELSVFGKGGRFGFIHDVLGVKEADNNIKAEGHGQVVNYEYFNKVNPDIIFAMDRGVAVGGKSSSKQVLANKVIKDVNAIKENQVIELDPYLWYFSSGGVKTTMQQIDEIEKAYK
ncbi:ferrated catecholamine ABC transporter substrate-binding lipoprotein SstD [Macrococcus bovicus]|uniref:ferrated catecholamine ABC transporter substrate-binding lipoprotein SstD n=1 Tax=Macrococcus bovicus TaxID=69968 RepID=UPI0025A63FF9|nr:ABC transporter substrate-binding protein [Macrococcus bovicus]WJP97661.1 ABC transporter substrate-binding protein [Macrococcus bovicus]